MRYLSQGVKVGILFIVLVAGSYGVWKTVGSGPSGDQAFEVWAKFRDASGLPLGSRVVIAGLPVAPNLDTDSWNLTALAASDGLVTNFNLDSYSARWRTI